MAITWTKYWTGTDDGSLVKGVDIKTLQDDISSAISSGVATLTRATFTNSDLSTGVLTVTHNLGLATPFALAVSVQDNNLKEILPDDITFATNSFTLDLTSYGTLTGTWSYVYIA